jgi:hypothetical protein
VFCTRRACFELGGGDVLDALSLGIRATQLTDPV